eukprot:c5149_g1_i1.p1 GENE.c5149_g1_i1~~c5149_g1_i1.p1  ORF type:complete len:204 (-),score=41.33 c5149_g1_i1:440-1051(-)
MKNASNDSNTNNNTHFDNNDNDNGFLSSTLNATPSAEIAGQLSQVLQSMSSISLLELQNWPAQTLPDPEHIVVAATMAHNINLWAESRWEAGFLQKARIQSHTTSQQVEQLIPSEASDFPDTISLDSELVAEGHHQVGHNHHHHDARHAAKVSHVFSLSQHDNPHKNVCSSILDCTCTHQYNIMHTVTHHAQAHVKRFCERTQ